jgi:hypothetical protein
MTLSSNDSEMFNWKRYLKIKLFSDCLCAAIPTKINYHDLYYNFLYFGLYISTYQNLLMEKGFFARGAISIGSYYSDNNMIFSGALVKSVELEKTANYPRILINPELVSEIEKTFDNDSKILNEMLVVDLCGNIFLNNFNIDECTNIMLKENIEKIRKSNFLGAEILEEGFSKTRDYKMKINESFKKAIESNINENIKLFQLDKRTCEKYIWIKQLFDWTYSNKKLTSIFKKYEHQTNLNYNK